MDTRSRNERKEEKNRKTGRQAERKTVSLGNQIALSAA